MPGVKLQSAFLGLLLAHTSAFKLPIDADDDVTQVDELHDRRNLDTTYLIDGCIKTCDDSCNHGCDTSCNGSCDDPLGYTGCDHNCDGSCDDDCDERAFGEPDRVLA